MTRALALGLVLALLASPARAQDVSGGGSPGPLVKYGKWVLAAGALGMNYLAARAHDRAQDNFDALERRCFDDQSRCDLNVAGSYADQTSETLYQQSLRYDRQARGWLFGGETALVGAAALFVWDLTRHTPKPDNIPFEPEVRSLPRGTGFGLKMEF